MHAVDVFFGVSFVLEDAGNDRVCCERVDEQSASEAGVGGLSEL